MPPRRYGTWPSPLSAATIAAQSVRLSSVSVDGETIWWIERRPHEGGRNVLVQRTADGRIGDVTPPGFNVRTRVHEYGGGAHLVAGGIVWCANFDDQRVYRLEPGVAAPVPVTPPGRWHYADATLDRRRNRLICVREDHSRAEREAETTLVAIPAGGAEHEGVVLASGFDFYATPRIDPAGTMLAWIAWRHPNMPWDGTELWVAAIDEAGALRQPRRVAGGPEESIYQPGWSPDGTLYFASDRTGWWQLYRWRGGDSAAPVVEGVVRNPPPSSEFGRPQWTFGTATWTCADAARLVVAYTTAGRWRLATVDVPTGVLRDVPTAYEPADWLAATPTHAVVIAGSPDVTEAAVQIDLETGTAGVLRSAATPIDPALVSHPVTVQFPSGDGEIVHAFYYAPAHPDLSGPDDERPPLVAIGHGGPTSATTATLDPRIQFWTTRGFAVVDVNYRGSSGYGRAYRERLNGRWGIVDVEDMVAAVQHLVRAGKADPARLIIRGGSAGGYTALAALAFHPGVFAAAASYYGVSDLEVLARDTHKFESRYLERLVGPYPAAREEYRRRSPLYAADRIACRLILFQGLDDRVVPPNQSEMMARAVRANGWPVAYLTFAGEQHGFRRADTIARCLEAELYFYGVALGFTPADPLEPVAIER